MTSGGYRIVEAQLPIIGGVAGHNFLVLLDPDGKVVSELHGLATDTNGKPKLIGTLPSDRLKGHEYAEQNYYQPDFSQAELDSGDRAAVMNLWNAARAAGTRMNELDIQYPWLGLGQNSNSFASTLIAAMGLTEPRMHGDAPITLGARSMLLEPNVIQDIQRQFNIGAIRSEDMPNSNSQPDGVDQPSPLDSARWPFGPVGAPGDRTTAPSVDNPRSRAGRPQVLPNMQVPGAQGPTSLGGPNGPGPLLPSTRSGSPVPGRSASAADPTLPPLQLAPEPPRSWGAPPSGNMPRNATSPQPSPGMAIPGAGGLTSIGGSSGPTPLMPPANSGSPWPAPQAAPTLPPLHFAPETPRNFGPFTTAPLPFGAPDGPGAVQKPGGLLGMMIDAGVLPWNPNEFASGMASAGGFGDTRSPVLRALEKYSGSAVPDGSVSTLPQGASWGMPSSPPGIIGTGGVLGNYMDPSLIAPTQGALPTALLSSGSIAPDLPADETEVANRKPMRYLSSRIASQPQASISSAGAQPASPSPQPGEPLRGIFYGEPMFPFPPPPSFWRRPDDTRSRRDDEEEQRWLRLRSPQ